MTKDREDAGEERKPRIPFTLFQSVVSILLTVIGAVSWMMFQRVITNGETLIEVQTVQRGVVATLKDLQEKGYVSQREHESLTARVAAIEKDNAKVEARIDIMLHDHSRDK